MTTASLELCQELYELSGWETEPISSWYTNTYNKAKGGKQKLYASPAYDLGYLLRKLPHRIKFRDLELHKVYEDDWTATYTYQGDWVIHCNASTPEDAACKLAIELFKQNILKRENQDA